VRTFAADEACGAFLSGGTDSSTLTGLLAATTGKPAQTFSIGFAAEGYDEMHYARVAARHFRAAHHEYYVTPQDVIDAIPRIAATYDQPFGNASAVPTYYCAKLAREQRHFSDAWRRRRRRALRRELPLRATAQVRVVRENSGPVALGVVEPIARRVPDATRFYVVAQGAELRGAGVAADAGTL